MHICIYLNYYYSVYLKCLGAVNAYLFSVPTHYMQWHSKRVAGMPPPRRSTGAGGWTEGATTTRDGSRFLSEGDKFFFEAFFYDY